MSMEATLYSALASLAPAYPLIAPQGAATPRITYLTVSGREWETLANGGGAPRVRVQIDIWSGNYLQTKTLATQAKAAIRAALAVGEITDNPDMHEPDTNLFRASFDVAVWA